MVNITIKKFSIFYFLPETLDLFQTISSSQKKKQNKTRSNQLQMEKVFTMITRQTILTKVGM